MLHDVYTFVGTEQLAAYDPYGYIYVNLLQESYTLSRYTFQITTINLLNESYYSQLVSS